MKYGWVDAGRRWPAPSATGRPAPAWWRPAATPPTSWSSVADTVTEMRKVKHAYDAGISALKGIEF